MRRLLIATTALVLAAGGGSAAASMLFTADQTQTATAVADFETPVVSRAIFDNGRIYASVADPGDDAAGVYHVAADASPITGAPTHLLLSHGSYQVDGKTFNYRSDEIAGAGQAFALRASDRAANKSATTDFGR